MTKESKARLKLIQATVKLLKEGKMKSNNVVKGCK